MKLEKDIENFFKENYSDYLQPISLVSKDDSTSNFISMIEDKIECTFEELLKVKKKYILVYNEEKNYLVNSFGDTLEGKVNIQILKELLSEYEEILVDKVLFMNKEEFERFYLKKYYKK